MTTLQAYTFPRPFSGFRVPIPLQSTYLRTYCADRSLVFQLHKVELILPGSYSVLSDLIEQSSQDACIGMCSAFMLPPEKTLRQRLLSRLLVRKSSLHLVLERIIVHDDDTAEQLSRELELAHETEHLGSSIAASTLAELAARDQRDHLSQS